MPFNWSDEIDPFQAAQALGVALRVLGSPVEQDPIEAATQHPVQTPEMAAEERNIDVTTDGFVQPFNGEYPVTSGFGPRGSGVHAGLDLGLPAGTPVLAAISGVVTHAASDDPGGYGTWIEITGANGISTRYGHLTSLGVKPGQQVSAGQAIGISGATGNARGAHLHFEVRQGGQAVDPTGYLSGAIKPVEAPPQEQPPVEQQTMGAAAPEAVMLNTPDQDPFQPKPQVQQQQQPGQQPIPGQDQTNLPGMDGYFAKVLQGIGAPITPANLAFMRAWMRAEGGSNDNPFNTTQDAPGATVFNSVGVKRYPSADIGIQATIQTLTNGLYGGIINALRQGTDPMQAARALAGSPWGTGALVMQILGG